MPDGKQVVQKPNSIPEKHCRCGCHCGQGGINAYSSDMVVGQAHVTN